MLVMVIYQGERAGAREREMQQWSRRIVAFNTFDL
jgi:hypothetical protein